MRAAECVRMARKFPLVLCVLWSAVPAFGEPIAIFARNDSHGVSSVVSFSDPSKTAFWEAFRRDRASGEKFEAALPLINPPAWGRTVAAETGGEVRFHPEFARVFVGEIRLHDLLPNHAYILTLNGNPEKSGNALLPTPVPGNENEKYYDFLDVTTDGRGRYESTLGIFLAPGNYDVRLYVKDATDFKIVLYRDFFKFRVRKS